MNANTGTRMVEKAGAGMHLKFQTPAVQVGLVGLGYVGLPLALLLARKGFRTTGFDIDAAKIETHRRRGYRRPTRRLGP